jgi:FMN phosphatase YigB (HAD superfamily)
MRQVEEFAVSPIEQELAFGVWCREKGIKRILFDGDDTLWHIVPIFRGQMEKCYDLLADTGVMTRKEWKKKVTAINDELYEKGGVNPERFNLIVERLAESYPIDNIIQKRAKNILAEIYQIPPKFVEGTEKGLEFLKKVGIPIGVVTHANENWTWRKYREWLKLDRFLNWDDIFIVDENGHKTKESWRMSMEYFKVSPRNCLGVGDSPRSDINPLLELGVNHCFLMQNQYEIWSIHQQPVDEMKTKGIKSVNDLRWLGKEIVYRT